MLTLASDGGEVVMVTGASLLASLADCGELLMLMTRLLIGAAAAKGSCMH